MNRKNVVLAGIIAWLIIIASGALLWEWVLGDTLAPSAPIAAISATAESTNTAITAPNLKVFYISQMESHQIAGDLTIRDTTKPVIFDVTARIDSENEINGSASTTVKRSDYHLAIPSVPFVANVSEEIALEIDFVANSSAVEGD